MLIIQLKNKEALAKLLAGKKVFVINCHGCKEVYFHEADAAVFEAELKAAGQLTGVYTTDYICNPENFKERVAYYREMVDAADAIHRHCPGHAGLPERHDPRGAAAGHGAACGGRTDRGHEPEQLQ